MTRTLPFTYDKCFKNYDEDFTDRVLFTNLEVLGEPVLDKNPCDHSSRSVYFTKNFVLKVDPDELDAQCPAEVERYHSLPAQLKEYVPKVIAHGSHYFFEGDYEPLPWVIAERVNGRMLSLVPMHKTKPLRERIEKLREDFLNTVCAGDLHSDNILLEGDKLWVVDLGE